MYALYFMLVTVICIIMMSPTVEQQMLNVSPPNIHTHRHIDKIKKNK